MTRVPCINMMHCIKMNSSKWVCIVDVAIRDIENRREDSILGAIFEKPSVCLCFGRIVIDRILSISVGSTGVRILLKGLARNLLTYEEM